MVLLKLVTGPITANVNERTAVVGVVSFGPLDCSPSEPTGHASVTNKMDWILQNTDAGDYQCPRIGKVFFG